MTDRYAAFAELVEDTLAVIESSQPGPSSRQCWLAAVEAQADLALQDQASAQRAVTSMLNQVLRLARSAPWWRSHSAAVIADTVEYASGNHDVSSAAAQQAWERYWAAHSALGGLGLELLTTPYENVDALNARMEKATEEWLANWDNWHALREQNEPRAT